MNATFSLANKGCDPLSQWSLGPPATEQMGLQSAPITQQYEDQQFCFPPLIPMIATGDEDSQLDTEQVLGTAMDPMLKAKNYYRFISVITKATSHGFSASTTERKLNLQKPALCSKVTLREYFKEQVLCSHHFRAFAIMQTNSPYITICHSIGKFFPSINTAAINNMGQCIAFVGDRTSQDPLPIAPPNTVWDWIVPLVYKHQGKIIEFYNDTDNYGTLFYPPLPTLSAKPSGKKEKESAEDKVMATHPNTEVEVPYLLSLPICIVMCLLHRMYWMSHELPLIVREKIAHFDVQVDAACWTPLTEWCLADAQLWTPTSLDSVVAISVNSC